MENQLQVLIKDSGLEETKGNFLLSKFQNYFQLASEWEKKAKSIVVTNEHQQAEMQMARTGRLFLREKRIAVEKSRKELKEQALREGKAIDGIANVLKALIIPIEEYLEKQEKFVEIREKEKAERARIEAEKKAEEDRIAQEKAEAEERERIKLENERLKKEAEEKEKLMQEERKKVEEEKQKQEKLLAEEKAKAEAERKRQEEERRKEREEAERKQREADAKAKAEQEKIKKEAEAKAEAERKERERLEEILKNEVECPHCHKKFQLTKEV